MSNRKKLQDRKAQIAAKMKDMNGKALDENRDLSEAEAKEWQGLQGEMTQVNAALDREAALADIERGMSSVQDLNGDDDDAAAGRASDDAPKPKFGSMEEFLAAVAKSEAKAGGHVDSRLVPSAAAGLNEGMGADGGFLVETEYANDLLRRTYEFGEIAGRLRRLPSRTGKAKINAVDETSRANGSRWGGVQAFWEGEGNLLTASRPKFREIDMQAKKLTGLCYATSEMLEDSALLESVIDQAFPEEFAFKIEDMAMNGTGTGMPLGWMNSGAVVTVSKETSQAAGTIFAMNIIKMHSRMPARLRREAVWLINQEVEPQLYPLQYVVKNVAGTENVGGFAAPIYTPPGENRPYGLLLGRPVIPVEYCAALGTAGDIQFVDPKSYLFLDRKTITKAVSMHVRFLYDEMAFRFILRADGQPTWNAPLTPFKGSATQSPFIILETR